MDKHQLDNQQNAEIRDLLLEMERMKTEIGVYKKIAGFMSGSALFVALSIGGWTFATADEYAQLKEKVSGQSGVIQSHGKKIEEGEKERSGLQTKMGVVEANTDHIKEKVGDIYDLVKTMIKQKSRN